MLCKSLLAVPETLEIEDSAWQLANLEVCYELAELEADWPGKEMPDTHAVLGQKLMRGVIEVPGDDPLLLVQGLLQIYSLPWELLALQEFGASQVNLDGTVTPHVFLPVQPKALTFLNDRPAWVQNPDGTQTQTVAAKEPWMIPVVSGQAPWV